MDFELDRRVYRPELSELTGWCATWIRTLEKRGTIPAGRLDPGGKRKWWPASEVRRMLAGEQPGAGEQRAA